jgi:serine/threonine protein kinase
MKLQLKIDSNPSPTSRKGHALFNLAIKDPSPSTKTSSEKKKKKPRFQLNELDLGEINRTSSLNVSNRTPEGPTMSLNATTFRFRSKLVVTKDGFRTADLDENVTRSDFCIVKELGRGAGGVVYKAVHLETLRVVAIKYVRANDAQKRSQIWHELQSLTENFEPLRDKFVPLRFCSNEDLLRWLHTIHFGPYSKQVVYINNMKNTKLFKTGRFGALLESCKGHTDLSEFIPKSTLHQKLLFRAITQANEAGGIRLPPKCPYIISFHGAYLDPERSNSVCIVIEYMDGGDLQGFLDAGVHCTETLIASIAFRMLRALGFLHSRNQAHRDIKPANALLTQRGDVKVSDYGIAKKITKDEEFKTFTGTTMYMSPERLDGLNYTVNADIWSLGITLMSLFMGRVPFSSKAKASFFNLRNEIVNNTLPRLEGASKEFQSFVDRCTCFVVVVVVILSESSVCLLWFSIS